MYICSPNMIYLCMYLFLGLQRPSAKGCKCVSNDVEREREQQTSGKQLSHALVVALPLNPLTAVSRELRSL